MNKILLTLMLTAVACLGFTACSDDDETSAASSSAIRIIQSSLFFPSQGGTGSIVVSAQGPFTVTSGADWCQATIDGETILLSAERNTTTQGRTAIITIKSSEAITQLAAQQRGIVYRFDHQPNYVYGDTTATAAMAITYDNETTVASTGEWLQATLSADTLHYTLSENTTGHVRSAWIRVQSGEYADSFKVVQYDPNIDIVGQYRLAGTIADGSAVEYEGRLAYTGRTLYFRVADMNWNIALTLADGEPTLHLKNAEYAGRYKADDGTNYYVSLLTSALVDGNFQLNLSSTYGMKAPLEYDPVRQTVVGTFGDDGSWASTGFTPNAILLWLTTSRTPNSSNGYGYLQALVDPYIYRIN